MEPDSISTVYRIRVEKRFGTSKSVEPADPLEKWSLTEISTRRDEMLVLKSGGATIVDGVLDNALRAPGLQKFFAELQIGSKNGCTQPSSDTQPSDLR
jgi:hypothetical protein